VIVLEEPEQIEDGEAVAVTLRPAPTATVADAVPEHPLEFDPVTEYVVVDVGLTVMLAVV
jgi:hypothetical protein